MTKYYDVTDRSHTIYAMSTILNPTLQSSYFEHHWTRTLVSYIPTMKTACHKHWKREYQPKTPSLIVPRKRTLLEALLHSVLADQSQDEWERWASASPIAVTAQSSSLFRWHVDNMEGFPTLHQKAFDTLSIPAMSAECERVFSSTKKLISPHQGRPYGGLRVLDGVVGLRNHCAELAGDDGGDGVLYSTPPRRSAFLFPNLELEWLWL